MPLARISLAVVTAAAVLALPAAAGAKSTGHGHGHEHATAHGQGHAKHVKRVSYLIRGTWSGGSVAVTGGNRATRRAGLVGETVALELDGARIKVRDADGDGVRDASDLRDGDRVVVQARGTGDGSLDVREVVDRARAETGDGTAEDAA